VTTYRCDNCGKEGAILAAHDTDFTPTDRGTERREYDVYLCDECFNDLSGCARIVDDPRERSI
jgi:hypothetical protein